MRKKPTLPRVISVGGRSPGAPKKSRAHTPKGRLYVHVPDATRRKIIEALATMDDEAFSWLVLAMPPSAMLHGGTCQIWPDGLGGFQDREKIEALRTAAQAWINARQK